MKGDKRGIIHQLFWVKFVLLIVLLSGTFSCKKLPEYAKNVEDCINNKYGERKKNNDKRIHLFENPLAECFKANVVGFCFPDYRFKMENGEILSTDAVKKPIFLQVFNFLLNPCLKEMRALNELVEKYHEQVDFIILVDMEEGPYLGIRVPKRPTFHPQVKKVLYRDKEIDERKHTKYVRGVLAFEFPTTYFISRQKTIVDFETITDMYVHMNHVLKDDPDMPEEEAYYISLQRWDKKLQNLIYPDPKLAKEAKGKPFKGIRPAFIEELDKSAIEALGAEKLDVEYLFKSKNREFEFKIPKGYFLLKNLMNDTLQLIARKQYYTIAVTKLPHDSDISLKKTWIRYIKDNLKKANMSLSENFSMPPFYGRRKEGKERYEYSYSTPITSVSGLIDIYQYGGAHIYCVRIECGYPIGKGYVTYFRTLLDNHFKLN